MEFFLKVSIGKIVTDRAPAVLEYWSHTDLKNTAFLLCQTLGFIELDIVVMIISCSYCLWMD